MINVEEEEKERMNANERKVKLEEGREGEEKKGLENKGTFEAEQEGLAENRGRCWYCFWKILKSFKGFIYMIFDS